MFIETKRYKAKIKGIDFVCVLSGMQLNLYFELGYGEQFEYIEEIKED